MPLMCTHCETKKPCRIIGDMFTKMHKTPHTVCACSFDCLLKLRINSIVISKRLISEFYKYMHNSSYTLRERCSNMQDEKYWPTMKNEKVLRRIALKIIENVSIYNSKLDTAALDLLAKLKKQ